MAHMRLADLSVRALKSSADYKVFFDTTVPGFGVRQSAAKELVAAIQRR